jgi:hypothetical protein
MMNLSKFNSRVSEDLHSGESVLVYVNVSIKGNVDQFILGQSASLYGGVTDIIFGKTVRKRIQEGQAEQQASGIHLDDIPEGIAGLTQQRFILWSRTVFGKPKELVFSIDRKMIRNIEMSKGKIVMMPMPAMRIILTDGSYLELLVGKIYEGRARSFTDF